MNVESYIRQAALARGIDPDVAVRVAKGEGGLKNPFRHGEGPAPKSQAPGFGPTENSFGPFQLYISGTNSGLGDRAVAAGIDPRKNWQGGIDYALDEAKNKGWGQWYGAKAQGITGMMGIGGAPSSNPVGIDGPKGQEVYTPPPTELPGLAIATNGSGQSGGILGGIPVEVAQYAASDDDKKSPLQNLFGALAKIEAPTPPRPGPMGDARQSGGLLLQALNDPKISDMLLKKRLG